jgi:hypothetical protein
MENEQASDLLEEASACAMYKLVVLQTAVSLLEKRGCSIDIQSVGKIVDDELYIDLLRDLLMSSEEARASRTKSIVEHIVQEYLKSKSTK